jgi:hypothetical protein
MVLINEEIQQGESRKGESRKGEIQKEFRKEKFRKNSEGAPYEFQVQRTRSTKHRMDSKFVGISLPQSQKHEASK